MATESSAPTTAVSAERRSACTVRAVRGGGCGSVTAVGGPGACGCAGRQQAAAAREPEDAPEPTRRVVRIGVHGVRDTLGIVAHGRARSGDLRGCSAGGGPGIARGAQPGPAATVYGPRAARSGGSAESGDLNAGRTPPVSVIVPARDAAATLARALESVLAQDYAGGFEVIVADGSEGAGTGALVRRRFPGVRLVPNPGARSPAD